MRSAVSVGTTIAKLSDSNWRRAALYNNGTGTVYVQWTQEANVLTSSNGFPVASGGQLFLYQHQDEGPLAAITAIAGSGTQEVRIVTQ